MESKEDVLAPHVIILPSYCPVMICLSKDIAEDVAKRRGYKEYRIRQATKKDVKCILDGYFTVREVKKDVMDE